MSFLGGLKSEWMNTGHGGGEGGTKKAEMGGRPLCTVTNCIGRQNLKETSQEPPFHTFGPLLA